ncbi:hypothetical protein DIPPA_31906 [Diplonema papillatum]|nr:hypothetical protein DIPPA_31906 [Diplonema papillatum]
MMGAMTGAFKAWPYVGLGLLQCAAPAAAAGKSIFKLGVSVDEKNWDVMGMYFICFGITIMLELIVHKLHATVASESGRSIVHHVTQEVMILGGISAVLVVFENMGGAALIDTALFHYVHFVIFVMAIMFIGLMGSLFFGVDKAWDKWTKFEHKILEIEADPSLEFDHKAAFLQQYIKTQRNGQRMLAGLIFFRQDLPGPLSDVSYSRYMKKMQRKFMLSFLNLHGSSWALLALLCLLAAVVTWITVQVSENELATIGLWTLFVGFGPLLILVITFFKIRKEYDRFTTEVLQMRMDHVLTPASSQKLYFWKNSPDFMISVIQTMLLYQVFFLATASINFTYRLVSVKPYGWLLLFVCFLPSGFLFFLMVPLVLPPFTILASLGDFLDHDTLLRMKMVDKASGKFRRARKRDEKILGGAPFTFETGAVLQKFSAPPDGSDDDDSGFRDLKHLPTDGIDHRMCTECGKAKASYGCKTCGKLCIDCDYSYHRLKQLARHERSPIGARSRSRRFASQLDASGAEMMVETESAAPGLLKSPTAKASYYPTSPRAAFGEQWANTDDLQGYNLSRAFLSMGQTASVRSQKSAVSRASPLLHPLTGSRKRANFAPSVDSGDSRMLPALPPPPGSKGRGASTAQSFTPGHSTNNSFSLQQALPVASPAALRRQSLTSPNQLTSPLQHVGTNSSFGSLGSDDAVNPSLAFGSKRSNYRRLNDAEP